MKLFKLFYTKFLVINYLTLSEMWTETKILKNIIAIRNKRGFSQEYVASKIGMKQSGYGLIERGIRGLNITTLLQIAIALETDIINIITYPKKYVDENLLENKNKVLVTFEISPDNREELLKMIIDKKKQDNK